MSLTGREEWMAIWAWLLLPACTCEKPSSAEVDRTASAASSVSEVAPKQSSDEMVRAVKQTCDNICERSRSLQCKHADECVTHCVGMAVGTPCGGAFLAFYRCLLPHPLSHWECAEDGVAAIREGFCDQEQGQALACMEAKMLR